MSGNTEHMMGMQIDREKRTVALLFEDDGIPYNPLKRPDPDVSALIAERRPGGLGIYLVKNVWTASNMTICMVVCI